MRKAVNEAVKVFCKDILGLEVENAKTVGNDFYAASIPIYENENEQNWFLFFKKPTLKKVAQILLFEDNLSEDEFNDLLKEISNQIIGMAKVKLEEKNQNITYRLGTPEFLGNISAPIPIKLESNLLYKIENRTFLVAMEAQDYNTKKSRIK
ncbi:MAG: restriction endonuclease [Sulfurospirillum sp.]